MSDFIHRLPKAELHLHLEGSVEPATLAELSRRHTTPLPFSGNKYEQPSEGLPVLSEDEVRALYQYKDFLGFLMAFKAVTERLRTADDYELITYRMMERLRAQNVLHAEVYVSVGVVHWRGQEFSEVFRGIETGRVRGEKDFGISLLWIFDAVRHFGPDAAQRVVEEAANRARVSLALALAAMSAAARLSFFARFTAAAASADCGSRCTPARLPGRNRCGAQSTSAPSALAMA